MMRGRVNSTLSRGYGTLAGLGIIGAAILAVPSTLLLDPLPPSEAYLATVAGLVTGLICMALPWERMDFRWLHVVGLIATVEAAVAVAVFGQSYTAFFFVIAVAVAYVTPEAKALIAHLLVIGVALFGPALWGPAGPEETLQVALVVFPLLCLSTGIFCYLRQRMVADRNSYRVFAEETLSLATRIAGRPLSAGLPPEGGDVDLPSWSRGLRISTRVSGAAACVLALPLISAGLAVAGVRLPSFAADTLGSVGIELPNQDSSSDEAKAATDDVPKAPHGAGKGGDQEPSAVSRSVTPPANNQLGMPGTDEESGSRIDTAAVIGGADDPGAPSASPTSPEGETASSRGGDGGSEGGASLRSGLGSALDGTLGSALDGTLSRIDGLLGGIMRNEESRESEGAERKAAPPPESDSAERGSDGFAGSGDEVDEGSGDDAEEDGGEGCDDGESDDDAAADPSCDVELG